MGIQFFGQFLLGRKAVTPAQLLDAIAYQEAKSLRFGEYSVARGYLSKDAVEKILEEQRYADLRFDEIAVQQGLLTPAQVEELYRIQKSDHVLLGEALIHQGVLTEGELSAFLAEYLEDQRQFIPGAVEIPLEVKDPLVMRDFISLTEKMLGRIVGMRVKAGGVRSGYRLPKQNDITILISLRGSAPYEFVLSTCYAVAAKIAAAILEEQGTNQSREVICDAVKEFSNIVCGNLAARMAQRGKPVALTAPVELSSGDDVARKRTTVTFPLHSLNGDLHLIVVEG